MPGDSSGSGCSPPGAQFPQALPRASAPGRRCPAGGAREPGLGPDLEPAEVGELEPGSIGLLTLPTLGTVGVRNVQVRGRSAKTLPGAPALGRWVCLGSGPQPGPNAVVRIVQMPSLGAPRRRLGTLYPRFLHTHTRTHLRRGLFL